MSGFLGLLFLIDLNGFVNFSKASAKNTGDVHTFKSLFVYVGRRFLRFFKRWSGFGGLWFFYDWCCLSAMKNSGRFHACFSFLFLLKPCGNRPSGFSVLEKATLLVFWGMFCGVLSCRS